MLSTATSASSCPSVPLEGCAAWTAPSSGGRGGSAPPPPDNNLNLSYISMSFETEKKETELSPPADVQSCGGRILLPQRLAVRRPPI